MAKKALRPTGRRAYSKRVVSKKTRSMKRTYGKFSKFPAATVSRFNAFPRIPNEFRVRLAMEYNTSISLPSSTTVAMSYWHMAIPCIPATGSTLPFNAAGLMHYLNIYQRAYCLRSTVKVKMVNNFTSGQNTTPNEYDSKSYRVSTMVLNAKTANDLSFVVITPEEMLAIPGWQEHHLLPSPHPQAYLEAVHSVDVVKFIGGFREDHSQAVQGIEGASNMFVQTPSAANVQNLPCICVMLSRNASTDAMVQRVSLLFEFDIQFENVRPLENNANQMKPWNPV